MQRGRHAECEYLTARLSIIGEVLHRLPQDTNVKRSLTEQVKTLGKAHDRVLAYKNWSTIRHLIGARRLADSLKEVNTIRHLHGHLRGGSEVAVKVLSKNGWHDDVEGAVVTEVEILFPLRHPHIVPLLGWCSEEEDRILVYHHEHMSNSTLRDHLLRLRRRVRVRASAPEGRLYL
ncbi:putative serine/threonine-protein kinase-like protein CCR3 [Hordeum vulgare]|nr:putative serine/threonine-protein kinase-like protein CCR3 [Hordeum vulgare]